MGTGTYDDGGPVKRIEAPPLPSEFDHGVYASAVSLDRAMDYGSPSSVEEAALLHGRTAVLSIKANIPVSPAAFVAWPDPWYIPGSADYQNYWSSPPDASHRYGFEWTNQPQNRASAADGTLYAFGQIRPRDRGTQSEAGIGVAYTPPFTGGVVTLQPSVTCTGQLRWLQLLDIPVAGSTQTTTDLILAQWQQIPTGWRLLYWRSFSVADGFVQSGSGSSPVQPYKRSLSSGDLATNFVVGKTINYLFGVVVRTTIWSTLTDSQGQPLPEEYDTSRFKIWGVIVCSVPLIEISTANIYEP